MHGFVAGTGGVEGGGDISLAAHHSFRQSDNRSDIWVQSVFLHGEPFIFRK